MDIDLKELRNRIINLSDDDLLKLVKIDYADYTEEALKIAEEEIKKRKISDMGEEKIEELSKQEIPIKWLNFYTYFRLPAGVVLGLIQAFVIGESKVIFLSIILSLLPIFVFIGLRNRRLWGWKLNWVLLGLEALAFPLQLEQVDSISLYLVFIVLICLVWVLPNYIYFKKRRHLFS